MSRIQVATFYRFTPLERVAELRARVEALGRRHGLYGTVLLAMEGVNATICGTVQAIANWERDFCALHNGFAGLEFRHSRCDTLPFRRWKVRIRPEIVTLGVPQLDPAESTGQHVPAQDWNELIQRDDVRVIDTRNHYECQIGSFDGAEDPLTEHFREFPDWVQAHLDPERDQHVAMFCTGGIRCEKATAYLLQQGFKNVYQLQGGVLEYLRTVDEQQSLWRGECFVFDDRVSLDHALTPSGRQICPACRKPLTPEEPELAVDDVCVHCRSHLSERQLAGVYERIRQVRLAAERGEQHLAPVAR